MREIVQKQYDALKRNHEYKELLNHFLTYFPKNGESIDLLVTVSYSLEDGLQVVIQFIQAGYPGIVQYFDLTVLPILFQWCKEQGLLREEFERFKKQMEGQIEEAKLIMEVEDEG